MTGDDGCFFVENGCLFHTDGEKIHFDIAISDKAFWGQSKDGMRMHKKADAETIVKIEKELDGTYSYSPTYNMVVRKKIMPDNTLRNLVRWYTIFGWKIGLTRTLAI